MAARDQDGIDLLFQRLGRLSADIRGIRESGSLDSDDAQWAKQLHQEVVALSHAILRRKFGQAVPASERLLTRLERPQVPHPSRHLQLARADFQGPQVRSLAAVHREI